MTDQPTGRIPHPNIPPLFEVDGMVPGGLLRIQTPLELTDGSLIDVYYGQRDDGTFYVSDLGEAENWLYMLGKRTNGRKSCVEACEADLIDGEIVRNVYPVEGDAVAIFCVAMAVYCMTRDTIEEPTNGE